MNKTCNPPEDFNSNGTASYEDGTGEIPFYTLLLFDWDDAVVKVQTIRADEFATAKQSAEAVMLTVPSLAGYQLWRNGRLVVGTYPQNVPAVPQRHPIR